MCPSRCIEHSPIPILMYHQVTRCTKRNGNAPTTSPSYSIPVSDFDRQMALLAENGYRALTVKEVIESWGDLPKKSIALTFDDGWADNYIQAFPVLERLKLCATLFVIAGRVGKDGYVDWSQLREMSERGFSVQSHTFTHAPLSTLSRDAMRYELEESKKRIEDQLGCAVDCLSVPHGMINEKVTTEAKNIGYCAICTSEPGIFHRSGPPAVLMRINIAGNCTIPSFKRIIEHDRPTIYALLMSKKFKNFIKSAIGYNLYRRLYRFKYRIGE